MKKPGKMLLFFLLFIIVPRSFILAGLEINEIMYDLKTGSDDGREWVEVYNNSDMPVDLSFVRLFEADTNHKLKLAQGDTNIPAKGYAVIVSDMNKFKIDWPNFSGTIVDSSFSLNNDGETLALKDSNLNIVDQYSYKSVSGGAGDGNSLQKINNEWRGAKPTPGEENKITYVAPAVIKNQIQAKPTSPPRSDLNRSTPPPKARLPDGQGGEDTTILGRTTASSPPLQGGVPEGGGGSVFPMIFLFIFLAGSAGAAYFIRRRGIVKEAGSDFEILDK